MTVGELIELLKKYPKTMEIKFWASPTEQLYLVSDYLSDKKKHRKQHLDIDMEFE